MALPLIKKIIPFDATSDYDISFSWTGNQVYGNQISIVNNTTSVEVYNNSVTSFQLMHTIPANTLINGIQYTISIRVWDINTTYSEYSSPLLFQCLATPVVAFTNLTANQVIRNSYYNFTFSYTQADGELLNEYQLLLYDSNKNQLATTGTLYTSTSSTLSGTLSGFNDNTQYYVSASYSTVNLIEGTTGLIPFSVDFIAPTNWSKMVLENTNDGMIKISSNVTLITGKSIPDSPTYIDDTKVDLTASGSKVYFDTDFTIDNDFCLELLGQKFIPYSTILEMSNGTNKIEIKWMKGIFTIGGTEQAYIVLNVYNSYACSRICSTPMDVPSDSQQIYILIKRINNLYDLKVTLK